MSSRFLLLSYALALGGQASVMDPPGAIDQYLYQLSQGNATAMASLLSEDAIATFPGNMGGIVRGRVNLTASFESLISESTSRFARATSVLVDGASATSEIHFRGEKPGGSFAQDDMIQWQFNSSDGLIQHLRYYSGGGVLNEPQPSRMPISLMDPSRGLLTNATVCLPPGTAKVPLLIFSHGWLLAAEDYDYLCSLLCVGTAQPWAVALIQTPIEDPKVQPPLLTPLAADAKFLSKTLLTTLDNRLTGRVVLGGHSMGGGTSVLAASPPLDASLDALALWAPGLYGNPNADATKVSVPTLIILGSSDCVNVPDVALRGIDTYSKLKSEKKALVVLKNANHCFWSTPVRGSCSYDICDSVPRLAQQAIGIRIYQEFASAVLGSGSWPAFENFLANGKDEETGVEWEAVATSTGSNITAPIHYPLCPAKCCSAALAGMGLCNNATDAVTGLW